MTYPHDDGKGNSSNRGDDRGNRGGGYPRDERGGGGYPRDDRRDPRGAAPASRPTGGGDDSVPSVPEGNYPVKATKHKIGEAGTGNKQIGVRLIITDGALKGNASLIWYGTFTDKSEDMTIRGMRALGFQGDDLTKMDTLYDGEAIAVVEHERNQDGKMIAKVKWLNGADIAMKKELDDNELAAFAKKMRGALQKRPSAAPAAKKDDGFDGRGPDRGDPAPRDDRGRQGRLDDPRARDPREQQRSEGWHGDDRGRGNNRPPDDDIPY